MSRVATSVLLSAALFAAAYDSASSGTLDKDIAARVRKMLGAVPSTACAT